MGEPAGYAAIADAIAAVPGVVTHGLFVDVATSAVIATLNGPRVIHKVRAMHEAAETNSACMLCWC